MDIEAILLNFQSLIKQELHKIIEEKEEITIVHNHPPVNYIVSGCPYCKKHGNIFTKTDSVKV